MKFESQLTEEESTCSDSDTDSDLDGDFNLDDIVFGAAPKRNRSDDDETSVSLGRKRHKEEQDLVCPFLLQDARSLGASCLHGYPSIDRLKEHLKRRHRPHQDQCKRCWERFPKPGDLMAHIRSEIACEVKVRNPQHSINDAQWEEVKRKRRGSLEEKWRSIYTTLFPGDGSIPSPYYHDNFVGPGFVDNMSSQLPARVWSQIQPVREQLDFTQFEELLKACIKEISEDFMRGTKASLERRQNSEGTSSRGSQFAEGTPDTSVNERGTPAQVGSGSLAQALASQDPFPEFDFSEFLNSEYYYGINGDDGANGGC
ncbi:hypothetical protein O1611_g8485 [Lasiodiplodia mahajangana]|uniref:Uncharacterized protein n=1 Tax=Lasiodiplodia mahajangana TaxID=1108764 RepID=A0ACC2JCM7_9PEZI|nr:hypothetical protein O1611_g8485 [Lasiodiplodia mahajangana]